MPAVDQKPGRVWCLVARRRASRAQRGEVTKRAQPPADVSGNVARTHDDTRNRSLTLPPTAHWVAPDPPPTGRLLLVAARHDRSAEGVVDGPRCWVGSVLGSRRTTWAPAATSVPHSATTPSAVDRPSQPASVPTSGGLSRNPA